MKVAAKKFAKSKEHRGRVILMGPLSQGEPWVKKRVKDLKIQSEDLLIAVDGGLDHWLSLKLRPDFAIGDWDSLKNLNALEAISHVSLPRDKDRSDLFYALEFAGQCLPSEVIGLGLSGQRLDHQLAVLYEVSQLLENANHGLGSILLQGQNEDLYFLGPRVHKWRARLRRGRLVSIFALRGAVQGVSLKGFKFALKNARLEASSLGLSNEALGTQCEVSIKKGILLIVVPRE